VRSHFIVLHDGVLAAGDCRCVCGLDFTIFMSSMATAQRITRASAILSVSVDSGAMGDPHEQNIARAAWAEVKMVNSGPASL
jgi:hypothetical protein